MKVILDTHVLLWSLHDKLRIGREALAILAASETQVVVSAASIWEIAIKRAAGKLRVPDELPTLLIGMGHEILPVSAAHAWRAGALPPHHRDPFDRLLVAQAQVEAWSLMTHNRQLAAYDAGLIWA